MKIRFYPFLKSVRDNFHRRSRKRPQKLVYILKISQKWPETPKWPFMDIDFGSGWKLTGREILTPILKIITKIINVIIKIDHFGQSGFRDHPRSSDPKLAVFWVIWARNPNIFKPRQIIYQNGALGPVIEKKWISRASGEIWPSNGGIWGHLGWKSKH